MTPLAVYKHMLGKQVDHRDLESIDPEYYKSLVWMLDNDIDGIIDLTFSVERDEFGVTEIVDLIPNGRNIAVTNENKHEYVRKIAEQRLSIEIRDQITVSRFWSGASRLRESEVADDAFAPAGSPAWPLRGRSEGPPSDFL